MKKFAVFFSAMAVLIFGLFSEATASIITFDNPPLPAEGYQIYNYPSKYKENGVIFFGLIK